MKFKNRVIEKEREIIMSDYLKPLDNEGWSEHYNMDNFNDIVEAMKNGKVSIWTEELLKICHDGETCLEIGCGTGISSLWLAKNGKKVTALDYTESSVALVRAVAEKVNISNIDIVCCDATKEMPFEKNQFDYIFQAGLLEHFETMEQIRLLSNWKNYGRYMISMIPNASSIPYRVGKQILENENAWEYGLELPKHTMAKEFTEAGIKVEQEYSVGTQWALKFLPKQHYINKFFSRLSKEGYNLDEYMQGYLLVTVGKCE